MADRNRNPQQALFNPRQGWPLGNRSAAGEFVQRGLQSQTSPNTAWTVYQCQDILITYPVAFVSAPIVLAGLSTTVDKVVIPGGYCVTTTTFRLFPSTTNSGVVSFTNIGWVALGA